MSQSVSVVLLCIVCGGRPADSLAALVFHPRCKLFYKKESEFKEKGVGTLHLKLTEQKKTQLIIRADTNLGKTLDS